jgi:5,10-methylenetetrahydromethanopterin reductase
VTTVRAWLAGEPPPSTRFARDSASAYLRFRPRRVTPIYLGAMGPSMLRLAGEVADGVLPLLFPPEHYFTVRPLIDEGAAKRAGTLAALDFAACVWVSLDDDAARARRALAEKIAYYGHAIGPMILERLGLGREDFAPIERMVMMERDLGRAAAMVDTRMLRIGIAGAAADVVARLAPLVAAGVRHVSFGPPLGPDPLWAVELLGRDVLPALRTSAGVTR